MRFFKITHTAFIDEMVRRGHSKEKIILKLKQLREDNIYFINSPEWRAHVKRQDYEARRRKKEHMMASRSSRS